MRRLLGAGDGLVRVFRGRGLGALSRRVRRVENAFWNMGTQALVEGRWPNKIQKIGRTYCKRARMRPIRFYDHSRWKNGALI